MNLWQKHDELVQDLAGHLRANTDRMVWVDMQLGPSGSPRPDVFTMYKSFVAPKPMAYEIKVSRSDFRADVTSGKWQSYLDFACGVYFCVPAGLVNKTDVPPQAGLMVRGPKGWRALKKPVLSTATPDFRVMMKLLIDGIDRAVEQSRVRYANEWRVAEEIRKRFGDEVACAIRDLGEARRRVQEAEIRREKVFAEIEQLRESIRLKVHREVESKQFRIERTLDLFRRTLGLPDDSTDWEVLEKARETAAALAVDERIQRIREQLDRISRSLARAKNEVELVSETLVPSVHAEIDDQERDAIGALL